MAYLDAPSFENLATECVEPGFPRSVPISRSRSSPGSPGPALDTRRIPASKEKWRRDRGGRRAGRADGLPSAPPMAVSSRPRSRAPASVPLPLRASIARSEEDLPDQGDRQAPLADEGVVEV